MNSRPWMCYLAAILLILVVVADSSVVTYRDQIIRPKPHGGAFEAFSVSTRDPSVISYIIDTKSYTITPGAENQEDLEVELRVFLGNTTHETTKVWRNREVNGNWTNVKYTMVADPCRGMQEPGTKAYLLVDSTNVTLVSDVAIGSAALVKLRPASPVRADATGCVAKLGNVASEGQFCRQYFKFDFSTENRIKGATFSLNLTIKSEKDIALPFTSAVFASGTSCPTLMKTSELDAWLEVSLSPNAPTVTPMHVNIPFIAYNTSYSSWWVMLDVPKPTPGQTLPDLAELPYSLTLSYNVVSTPKAPSPPPKAAPPSKAPASKPVAPPTRPPRPIPIWLTTLISLGCVALAVGALIVVWRLTRKKNSAYSNEYEIY